MPIPTNEQIDALLTGRTWNLVRRYCDGRWADLAREWTVSVADIRAEADRRGLQCFVSTRPVAEGWWLSPVGSGYEVFYFERGSRMYQETFDDVSDAFDAWLRHELKGLQLPAL
jgi:hypothetical protein